MSPECLFPSLWESKPRDFVIDLDNGMRSHNYPSRYQELTPISTQLTYLYYICYRIAELLFELVTSDVLRQH